MVQAGPVTAEPGGWERLLVAATVAIEVPGPDGTVTALGTGCLVAPRVVATCAHVLAASATGLPPTVSGTFVASGRTVTLHTAPGWYFRDDHGVDLALLALTGDDEPPARPVLISAELSTLDEVWAYGHPSGPFRSGQPATFRYEGASRRGTTTMPRLRGTPVTEGFSGAAAVNVRTGAVCGLLSTSDLAGGAHLVPAAAILTHCDAARLISGDVEQHREWLAELTDEQVGAGRWRFPGPRLRGYLATVKRAADLHPYPGVLPGTAQPPLSAVYVHQFAWADADADADDPGGVRTRVPAPAVFDGAADAVLVGVAGAGKSSLVRQAMRDLAAACERGAGSAVPVRVQAADLTAPRPFAELVAASVNADLSAVGLRQPWPAGFFGAPPAPDTPWLVLVDGLDEVMSVEARRAILARLRDMHADAGGATYRFVVVSRPDDQLRHRDHHGVAFFELLPFSGDDLATFAGRWCERLGVPDVPAQVDRFVGQIAAANLTELARNPLMATMLCQLFLADPERGLPTDRTGIYESYTGLLADRQYGDSRGGIRQQVTAALARYGADAERAGERLVAASNELIGRLAYERMAGNDGTAEEALSGWTASLRPAHVPERAWRALLRELLRRSGLLVERDGDFRFSHQTVEEFQAARYASADPARAGAAFRAVFAPDSAALTREWLTLRQSYARFLIGSWQDRSDLAPALRRLARSGVDGARLIAALASDGVRVDGSVVDAAVRELRKLAARGSTEGETRRAAADLAVALRPAAGAEVLASLAVRRRLDHATRRWAVGRLAALAHGEAPSRSYDRTTMRKLAEGPRWRDLLRRVALDSTMDSVDRRWAAESLAQAGDARGTGLLVRLYHDPLMAPLDRKLAADVLAEAGVPTGLPPRWWRLLFAVRRLAGTRPVPRESLDDAVGPLIDLHRRLHPGADVRPLVRAYDFAQRVHAGTYRRSGDEAITHPVAVARLLAEIGADTTTLTAALLHEGDYPADVIRDAFGADTAALVAGMSTLDELDPDLTTDPAAARDAIAAAVAQDPRVLAIKLADRLHNLRTASFLPRPKREQKARETLEILSPLARRYGLEVLRRELEDAAFRALLPELRRGIARQVADRSAERAGLLSQVTHLLQRDLKAAKIKAEVVERPPHLYRIYQTMIAAGRDLDDINDPVSVRILVDTVRDCYAALGVVHARLRPVPGRFRDYIAMPKPSMYQSLHTTVIGPGGKPVEMRFRTPQMHRVAGYGIVAGGPLPPTWLPPAEELRDDERLIYPVTPAGDAVALPVGSTPVDFAYAVDTEVGHRCIGARVNGKLVPLESTIASGDTVEIFTSTSEGGAVPSQDWLTFVRSGRARAAVEDHYGEPGRRPQEATRDSGIAASGALRSGLAALEEALRRRERRLVDGRLLMTCARAFGFPDALTLLADVGSGGVSADDLVDRLIADADRRGWTP